MALIDTLGAAQRGATAGMQNYAVRLASAQAANQVAANAVQRELDRQRILRSTGVTPRTTSADVFASQATPEFKPIGGEVTPTTIQQKRTNYTGFVPPVYSPAYPPAAPVAAPVAAPAAPAATAAAPVGLTPPATGGSEAAQFFGGLWQNMQMQGDIKPRVGAISDKLFKTADPFGTGGLGNWMFGSKEQGVLNAEMQGAGRWFNSAAAGDYFMANPNKLAEAEANPVDFYKKNIVATATPATATPATAETAAAAPIPTASQRSGYENTVFSTVGLTPPPAAEQPVNEPQPAKAGLTEDTVDPNLPPEYASRNARMRMTPDGMEWRGQQFMAERESITQAINQDIQNKQYAYQVGVESRNRQYENLVAQARDAATAGNTTYAQTLMTQAETILQQADDADVQIRKDVDEIRAKANFAYSKNDMDLWLHQATIAEQEFMRGNNPSRMLSIMEAMGNPTEIEDAGGGLYRIRHPAEGGGYIYERDSSGKVLEVPNTGVSDYMMRIISEERKAQDIANQAAAAALESERGFKLTEIIAKANAEKIAEAGLKQDEYTWTQLDDGSLAAQPKAGGPLKIVTQIPADGDTPARVTVVEVPL